MQRSKPSPVWSAFYKKTPRYGTFRMYPSMLPSPRRGECHLPTRNNLLITYQVGRIRSVSNIMPFNGTLNQPSWWEDPLLQRVRWWQETVPFKETRRPSAKDEEQDREYRRILLFLPSKRIFSECSIDNGLVKIYNIFVKFTNGGKEYEKILSTCTRPGNGYWHAGCRQRQGCGRRHG